MMSGRMFLEMSPWQHPPAAGIQLPGIVQIKLLGSLLDYPTGKSAMVWYGAGASIESIAAKGLRESQTVCGDQAHLQWRYAAVNDPETQLQALLGRFADRFGALPRAHQRHFST